MRTRPIILLPISAIVFLTLQSMGVIKLGSPISLGWVGYLSLMVIALLIVDTWYKFKIKELSWIYIAATLHMVTFALVTIFDLYSQSILINRFEHAAGSFILIWAVWILANSTTPPQSLQTRLMQIFAVANVFAVFNEIIELGLDFFLHAATIGPELWDTNLDLLMNWIGMGVFILTVMIFKKPNK